MNTNKPRDIGFERALALTMENVHPLDDQILRVDEAVGWVVSRPVYGRVDSPSVNASLKDGYAVFSGDIAEAAPENPVSLSVTGVIGAGDRSDFRVTPGTAVRILSGARIPEGADAVLAEEFTRIDDDIIFALAAAGPGRNILEKGTDVRIGELLVSAGQVLLPQLVGLLVAGGIYEVPVYRRPRVGLLATGSEILLPGDDFVEGKLYASNMALQHAWLLSGGFDVVLKIAGDSESDISDAIESLMGEVDVVITSGGAWKSDRDLVVKVLDSLGWEMIFHRVRMGPGKAVGMGILSDRPVFCLPGGPASNETAFIMLVFPAVLKMAGYHHCPYLNLHGRLDRTVYGQLDWTQFIQCDLAADAGGILLYPRKIKSRMAAMAKTPAVVIIPEGIERIAEGTVVPFICVDPHLFAFPIPTTFRS